jgi:hypothetical protein
MLPSSAAQTGFVPATAQAEGPAPHARQVNYLLRSALRATITGGRVTFTEARALQVCPGVPGNSAPTIAAPASAVSLAATTINFMCGSSVPKNTTTTYYIVVLNTPTTSTTSSSAIPIAGPAIGNGYTLTFAAQSALTIPGPTAAFYLATLQ